MAVSSSTTEHPLDPHVIRMASKDHLTTYIRDAARFPMISADEEVSLAKKWHEEQDPKAMKRLMEGHLKLVVKLAQGYRGYGMALSDLIAEGNIGMMQAVKRFDHTKGFRFSTYAMWWIHAQLKDYIMKNWSLVKIGTTQSQKKLFFGLRSIKRKILNQGEEELSDDHIRTISEQMNVSEKEIKEMDERLHQDYSLNARVSSEDDGEWQDWLGSDVEAHDVTIAHQQELEKRQALLRQSLSVLTDRDRTIFIYRRLTEPPKTLDEIAHIMDVSGERVRQIEVSAFAKLQKEMHKHAKDLHLH